MPTITAQELKEKLDRSETLVILDVREPYEYSDWHIPNSINIPFSRLIHSPIEAPNDSEIVAVCAHGMRSAAATRYLVNAGFHNVCSLEGGMAEWNGIYDIVRVEDIIQVRRDRKGFLIYILHNNAKSIVIDHTIDMDIYTETAKTIGTKIVAVLDTHAHADHASGSRDLSKRLGVPYYAPEEVGRAQHVKDGDVIKFGTSLLTTLATPGHTPGSVTYIFEKQNNLFIDEDQEFEQKIDRFIFTGDTLFVDGVGRPDLGQDASKNAPILYESIQQLLSLPDDTTVLPAHTDIDKIHPEIPVKERIEGLKQLIKTKEEFVLWIAQNSMPPPVNFEIIKKFNTGLILIERDEFRELEAGANRCAVK